MEKRIRYAYIVLNIMIYNIHIYIFYGAQDVLQRQQFWCEKNRYILSTKEQHQVTRTGIISGILSAIYTTTAFFGGYQIARYRYKRSILHSSNKIRILYQFSAITCSFIGYTIGIANTKSTMIDTILHASSPLTSVRYNHV